MVSAMPPSNNREFSFRLGRAWVRSAVVCCLMLSSQVTRTLAQEDVARDAAVECEKRMPCDTLGPVCGADGQTYMNPCHADCSAGGYTRGSCDGNDEVYITDGSGTARLGTPCVFPFVFQETEYNGCIVSPATPNGWCGVSSNVDQDGLWGGCTTPSILEQVIASMPAVCPPGSYTLEDKNCQLCAPGSYAATANSTQCLACPAGSSARAPGASSCTRCHPGSYAAEPGSLTCERCEQGTFAAGIGAETCEVCEEGLIAPLPGSSRCISAEEAERLAAEQAAASLSPAELLAASGDDAKASVPFTFQTYAKKDKDRLCMTAQGEAEKVTLEKCSTKGDDTAMAQRFIIRKVSPVSGATVSLRTMTQKAYEIQFRAADGTKRCLNQNGFLAANSCGQSTFHFAEHKAKKAAGVKFSPTTDGNQCMITSGKKIKEVAMTKCAKKPEITEIWMVASVLGRE